MIRTRRFIMDTPDNNMKWQYKKCIANYSVLFCPHEIERLELDKNIIKYLSAWIHQKTYRDENDKVKSLLFLETLPEIKGIADLLDYASFTYFKEITGFINYLLICN